MEQAHYTPMEATGSHPQGRSAISSPLVFIGSPRLAHAFCWAPLRKRNSVAVLLLRVRKQNLTILMPSRHEPHVSVVCWAPLPKSSPSSSPGAAEPRSCGTCWRPPREERRHLHPGGRDWHPPREGAAPRPRGRSLLRPRALAAILDSCRPLRPPAAKKKLHSSQGFPTS